MKITTKTTVKTVVVKEGIIYLNKFFTVTKETITEKTNRTGKTKEIVSEYLKYTGKQNTKNLFFALVEKNCLDIILNNDFSTAMDKLIKGQKEIKKPFTFIQENGVDSVMVLGVQHSNHTFYDENLEYIPTLICFDYITARTNNYNYDLKLMQKALEQRTDITFITDKQGNIIKEIPHYNADFECFECIEFLWKPNSLKEYKMFIEQEYHNRYDQIIEKIFKLNRLRLNLEEG